MESNNISYQICRGSYAEVKLCLNTDNKKKYAMKMLSKKRLKGIRFSNSRTAFTDIEREIAIMKKLNHPNVVNLIEVLDDPAVDMLYIIMDYIKNGPLISKFSKTKSLPI